MAGTEEFYLPGGNGHWDDAPMPATSGDAQERIRVLEQALSFYSDCRSYNRDSGDNETPSYDELMDDKGVRARIGRLATTTTHYAEWAFWASGQDRRY